MDQALESHSAQRQVRLSTLFWLMVASAFLLAHARSLGADGLWLLGYYLLFVVLCSSLVGIAFGRWADVAYWSALTSLLAFLAVAGGHFARPKYWSRLGIRWGCMRSDDWTGKSQKLLAWRAGFGRCGAGCDAGRRPFPSGKNRPANRL